MRLLEWELGFFLKFNFSRLAFIFCNSFMGLCLGAKKKKLENLFKEVP